MKYLLLALSLIATQLFSQGYYLEYKLSSEKEGALGSMKMFAQNGNSRSEMDFSGSAMAGFAPKGNAALFLTKNPETIYMLNASSKTFMEIALNGNDEWADYPQSEYDVVVVGKEKVNGYNTTHVRVKAKGAKQAQDMWLSKEVEGYADFNKIKSRYTGKDNLNKVLAEKGVDGFPVRVMVKESIAAFQMDLVKAEKTKLETSLFSLDGYKRGSLMQGLPESLDLSIMKDIQNMSPDEQRKAMEQLLKQLSSETK